MARRPDSAPASTLPTPGGSLADQAAAERRALRWWRLRTWGKDLDALTRLRDGLQAIELDDQADSPDSSDYAGAADADTGQVPAMAAWTPPTTRAGSAEPANPGRRAS